MNKLLPILVFVSASLYAAPPISVQYPGAVKAAAFIGDGSQLTGITNAGGVGITNNQYLPGLPTGNGSAFTNITDALHDADAIAYWTALGITDTSAQDRINNFFKVLKQYGLWANLVDGAMMASDLGGGTRSLRLAYGTNSAGTDTSTLGMSFLRTSPTYSIWPVSCGWLNTMVVDMSLSTADGTGGSYAQYGLYGSGSYDTTNGQFLLTADNGVQAWQGTNFAVSGSAYDPSSQQANWADGRERVLATTYDNSLNYKLFAENLLAITNLQYYTSPVILTNIPNRVILGSAFFGSGDYRYPCGGIIRAWLLFSTVLSSNQLVQVNVALRWLDSRPENWVFLGDSQTGELDAYPAQNYPAQFYSVYGVNNARMWNWGISGIDAGVIETLLTSRMAVSPLGGNAKSGRAFILAGVNDIGGGFTARHTYDVITNLCYAVKTNGYAADLLVQQIVNTNQISYPPIGNLLAFQSLCVSNPAIADRIWRRDMAFSYSEMDTNNGLTVDGLHLTPLGNKYQAQMLGQQILVPGPILASNAFGGSGITTLNASSLASGTIPSARFPSPFDVTDVIATNLYTTITNAAVVGTDVNGKLIVGSGGGTVADIVQTGWGGTSNTLALGPSNVVINIDATGNVGITNVTGSFGGLYRTALIIVSNSTAAAIGVFWDDSLCRTIGQESTNGVSVPPSKVVRVKVEGIGASDILVSDMLQYGGITNSSPPVNAPNIYTNDFEGGTQPLEWTVDNASVAWNYTPAILGSSSLGLNGTGVTHLNTTTNSEVYLYFQMRLTNIVSSLTELAALQDAGGSIQYIYLQSDNRMSVYDQSFAHSGTTVSTMTSNTTYHVWVHYKAGSGANQIGSVAFNTVPTEPTVGDNFASFPNGANTESVSTYEFRGVKDWTIIDHLAISTTDMSTGW